MGDYRKKMLNIEDVLQGQSVTDSEHMHIDQIEWPRQNLPRWVNLSRPYMHNSTRRMCQSNENFNTGMNLQIKISTRDRDSI